MTGDRDPGPPERHPGSEPGDRTEPGEHVDTVLAFEGQGARTLPASPPAGSPDGAEVEAPAPVDLAGLAPADAQAAIVTHQVHRAGPYLAAGRCAVLGQSLGEISALVVAGALEPAGALELVRLRAELPARLLEPRDWTMASLTRVGQERAAGGADGLPLWIIGRNGPADCIVVGEAGAFRTFVDRLGLTAATYRELPVTYPYHTPIMAPVAEAMAAAIDRVGTTDPAIPVVSPTGPRQVPDAAGARSVLVDALVSPVAWSEALTWAARRWGGARWRECGPSASLHRFVWKNGLELDWAEAPPPLAPGPAPEVARTA